MDRDDTGCQAPLEGPFLCINNCGFFGSAATKNMCSKCHRNMILNQGQAKLSASSTESLVNGSSRGNGVEPVPVSPVVPKAVSKDASSGSVSLVVGEEKAKKGPIRCTVCNKRVGLTGFSCRCENLFCAVHRYSDKHECAFNYQIAAQDAISKANPVVKSEKLDKI